MTSMGLDALQVCMEMGRPTNISYDKHVDDEEKLLAGTPGSCIGTKPLKPVRSMVYYLNSIGYSVFMIKTRGK